MNEIALNFYMKFLLLSALIENDRLEFRYIKFFEEKCLSQISINELHSIKYINQMVIFHKNIKFSISLCKEHFL